MPTRPSLAELFAQRLAEIRRWRGLSQRVLGERLGLSKKQGSSRVNRYERGGSFGTAESLDALARVLDVPAAAFLASSPAIAEILLLVADKDVARQWQLVDEVRRLVAADPTELEQLRRTALTPSSFLVGEQPKPNPGASVVGAETERITVKLGVPDGTKDGSAS